MPPYNNDDGPAALTANLRAHLARSRKKFDEYIDREKARVDEIAQAQAKLVTDRQGEINRLEDTLAAVQLERGLAQTHSEEEGGIAKAKIELLEQQKVADAEVAQLQEELNEKETNFKEIRHEEEKEQARAEKVRRDKELVEESKKTTVDDLTNGLVYYKQCSGLDFAHGKNGLIWVFTQLDRADPDRKFTFHLRLNDQEKYEMVSCKPSLDDSVISDLLAELNLSNDMDPFTAEMRKAFLATTQGPCKN